MNSALVTVLVGKPFSHTYPPHDLFMPCIQWASYSAVERKVRASLRLCM